jgi:hypothetical protein
MTTDAETLYGQLVHQHGGDGLDLVGRSLCRRIAGLLVLDDAADPVGTARTIAELMKQLPPPRPAPAPAATGPHDMSALTDRELDEFHRLLIKVTVQPGREPIEFPPPDPQLVGGRAESSREYAMREVGRKWDQIEREGVSVNARQASEVGDTILDLLPTSGGKPLLRLDQMWPELFRFIRHHERADGVPAAVEVPAPANNVVDLSEAERERAAELRDLARLEKLMTVSPDRWNQ